MSVSEKMCMCKELAFVCTDISNGKIIYSCARPKKIPSSFKKYIKTPDTTKTHKPCKFALVVDINEHGESQDDAKTAHEENHEENNEETSSVYSKNKQIYSSLRNRTNYFIINKYFVTFQEIEHECKKLQIPTYDHKNETMYEFCKRIIDVCEAHK